MHIYILHASFSNIVPYNAQTYFLDMLGFWNFPYILPVGFSIGSLLTKPYYALRYTMSLHYVLAHLTAAPADGKVTQRSH